MFTSKLCRTRVPRQLYNLSGYSSVGKSFSSHLSLQGRRFLATASPDPVLNAERASEEVDVCIVGAGPSGLSAAIKIRQMALKEGKDTRVFVVEKGSEVGKSLLLFL